MGVEMEALSESLTTFINGSPVFFIATAPSGADGHVNCSPRPMDGTFFVESPKRVGWLDLVGSGIETVAHLKENGRIVLMFCSFSSKPLIMRLHGHGVVLEPGEDGFESRHLLAGSPQGVRAIVIVEIERVTTSCGYGVPIMEFVAHRSTIGEWLERKGEKGLIDYRMKNNLSSIDGLPGLDSEKVR